MFASWFSWLGWSIEPWININIVSYICVQVGMDAFGLCGVIYM